PYPAFSDLSAEEEEEAPSIIFTVLDSSGRVVRRLNAPLTPGMNRINWALRYPAPTLAPPRPPDAEEDPFAEPPGGPLVMPGKYSVAVSKRVEGVTSQLSAQQDFTVFVEGQAAMTGPDRAALVEFQQKVAKLQRAAS